MSAVLITGPRGHILVDGALPQSAALIEANIKALGFRIEDVKLIVNSHAHWDHAGGIAALQRASGAVVAASASGALALQKRHPWRRRSAVLRQIAGAHREGGQGAGRARRRNGAGRADRHHRAPDARPHAGQHHLVVESCEGQRCMNVVYADSLNPISRDGFHFTGKGGVAGYLGRVRRQHRQGCRAQVRHRAERPSVRGRYSSARPPPARPRAILSSTPMAAAPMPPGAAKLLDERLARGARRALILNR